MRLCAVLCLVLTVHAGAAEAPRPARDRSDLALEFAQSAADCFSRDDSAYAAFRGCLDWHSAVHAAWALAAYQRMTEDNRFKEVLFDRLNQQALADEGEFLLSNPSFELPYGRAWLLHLEIEFSRAYEDDRIRFIADVAARSLHDYLREPYINFRSEEYTNATWALLSLIRYESHLGKDEELGHLKSLAINVVSDPANACAVTVQRSGGFFDSCALLAWLAAEVLSEVDLRQWVETNLPSDKLPDPVRPTSSHSYGVNFSRAWGYWALWSAGAPYPYLASYESHFYRGLEDFRSGVSDYYRVGHWVAQFGLLALRPMFFPNERLVIPFNTEAAELRHPATIVDTLTRERRVLAIPR